MHRLAAIVNQAYDDGLSICAAYFGLSLEKPAPTGLCQGVLGSVSHAVRLM
jgi:hypothetical protein